MIFGASPIELWKVDLDGLVDALGGPGASSTLLLAGEQDRLLRMQDTQARARRAASWIALRWAAALALGVPLGSLDFARDVHGKPILPTHNVDVSLAHTEHFGLIGISRKGPIGVDIDRVRSVKLSAPRRAHLIALGVALADGAPVPEPETEAGFVQAWTRIEAVAKARGDGLARLLGEMRQVPHADPHFAAADLELGLAGFRATAALGRAQGIADFGKPRWFGPGMLTEPA